ncbi:Synaptotagmin-9 [Orchesella cincta]|uniref:Synaptotagmin-9 n=1 Tax=Orchesella cincta TaxID=48709 RepID=A0A1D2MIG0_ORCCI|nr:Synaptotagmin-9 [Orchesella cincta]
MTKFSVFFGVALLGSICWCANAWPAKTTSSTTAAPKASTPAPGTQNTFNLTFVVAAKDLPAKKKNSLPDPYIKVFSRIGTTQTADWTPITPGQTDTLDDNASPQFNNVFWFIWNKGTGQQWHFEAKSHNTIGKDDALGQVDVNVDDYVLKNNQDLTVKLSDGGSLIIKKTIPVRFSLYARNLPKMDTFGGASDPFVECYWRIGRDGNDTLFYTTQKQDDKENADWLDIIEFSNYQKATDQYWHFKVLDHDSTSGNDYLGDALVEIDPFVTKRAAKVNKLQSDNKDNKGTLTVTPA